MHTKTPDSWLIKAPAGVFFIPYLLLFILNISTIYAVWPISGFNVFQTGGVVLVWLLINMLIIHTLHIKQTKFINLIIDTNRQWQTINSHHNASDIQVLKFWYGYFWITLKIQNIHNGTINYVTIWKANHNLTKWKHLLVKLEWEFTIGQTHNKGNNL